jgi:hypothetical protein
MGVGAGRAVGKGSGVWGFVRLWEGRREQGGGAQVGGKDPCKRKGRVTGVWAETGET